MEASKQVDSDVTVGRQPREEEIPQLASEGFRSVVNLRRAGEDRDQLAPDAEGQAARRAGLEYRHMAVGIEDLRVEMVDRFRGELAALPKPVYVHCAKGGRAAALVLCDHGVRAGLTGDEALARGEEMGFTWSRPELSEMIRTYVDRYGGR